MKFQSIFLGLLICCISCKRYTAKTDAMAGTINEGESFSYMATDSVSKGDVVVFDNSGEVWVQRVIAKSGETIRIIEGDVIVNGKQTPLPINAVIEYNISALSQINLANYPTYNIISAEGNHNTEYKGFLVKEQFVELRKNSAIDLIAKVVHNKNESQDYVIQLDSTKWNADFFGPLRIPNVGDEVFITPENSVLYKLLKDSHQGKMIIKEKLYFLMGDNRHSSYDSRFIGFIPESLILGVVNGK